MLGRVVFPQTFIKVVNYQHMMPTRYQLDVELKGVVSNESLEKSKKKDALAVWPLTFSSLDTLAISNTHHVSICFSGGEKASLVTRKLDGPSLDQSVAASAISKVVERIPVVGPGLTTVLKATGMFQVCGGGGRGWSR